MWEVLGLDRQMRETYRMLLREQVCTAADVSERLGLSWSQAEDALDRLAAAGLAVPMPEAPHRIIPVDPQRSFGPLLARRQAEVAARQQELARTQEAVLTLVAAFSTREPHSPPAPPRFCTGVAEVCEQIEALLLAAQVSVVCVLPSASWDLALTVRSDPVEQALDRGVTVRVLYPDAVRTDPAALGQAKWLLAAGGVVRVGSALPPALIIVDGRVVLVPADGEVPTALVVYNRPMTRALGTLFDLAWQDAYPVQAAPAPDPSTGLSNSERCLLRLLGKGMTDASAARQLGVSLRTVRRMMAEIMARLGARSRFEAGIRAAERGWIGSAPRTLPHQPATHVGHPAHTPHAVTSRPRQAVTPAILTS
jgi:sugar-specific transcriptional regulator TrmB/DNA-binding CsgD family transcriptional regulator